jgi:hypothetical protein
MDTDRSDRMTRHLLTPAASPLLEPGEVRA